MKTIFIISGDKGSGKSTFLINILSKLQKDGFVARGLVAKHYMEAVSVGSDSGSIGTDSYSIQNVETNEEFLFLQRVSGYENNLNHFKVFAEGEQKGLNWINEMFEQPPNIAVIDEIGGYELQGKLWSKGFARLVESDIPLIFTVKTKLLNKVVEKWNIDSPIIFDSGDFNDSQKAFVKIKECIQTIQR